MIWDASDLVIERVTDDDGITYTMISGNVDKSCWTPLSKNPVGISDNKKPILLRKVLQAKQATNSW